MLLFCTNFHISFCFDVFFYFPHRHSMNYYTNSYCWNAYCDIHGVSGQSMSILHRAIYFCLLQIRSDRTDVTYMHGVSIYRTIHQNVVVGIYHNTCF